MVYRPKYEYLYNEKELKEEINAHKEKVSITEIDNVDAPLIMLNFKRAENELKHAETIFKVSDSKELKKELELLEQDTFYSGVITHAYYAIFYATKALLLKYKVRTRAQTSTKQQWTHLHTILSLTESLILNY
ncbi:HEPN domain-containing protein [Candidatus Woesearchaeota archaeon]|nr:HEPN domain-containing protein [Candidatus Woesearchaeota archaeon]